MARPRRKEWRGRLTLTGDERVDRKNRAKMLDVLHESLMRARESTLRALQQGPVRVGEVVVGEVDDQAGPPIEAELVVIDEIVTCSLCHQGASTQQREGRWLCQECADGWDYQASLTPAERRADEAAIEEYGRYWREQEDPSL